MLFFLKKHGFLSAFNAQGNTPLQEAVMDDDIDVVLELLDEGVDVNGIRVAGETALHYVESEVVAKALVRRGANVHAKSFTDETPIHEASHAGRVNVVEYLISMGANINEDSDFGTPLDMAIANGRLAVVEVLLENGATVSNVEKQFEYLKEHMEQAKYDHFNEPGLYEKIFCSVESADLLRINASLGNVDYFVTKLCNGHLFYAAQAAAGMHLDCKQEFASALKGFIHDMRMTYVLFHSENNASMLFYPGPIAECVKSMLLLPKQTRPMLKHPAFNAVLTSSPH